MKHSEVTARFAGKHEAYREYAVLLAEPDRVDGDDIDVIVAGLGAVDVMDDDAEICLFPPHSKPEGAPPMSVFGMFIAHWPLPGVPRGDYDVMIVLPLGNEDDDDLPDPRLVPVADIYIDEAEQEIWFLTSPRGDYPPGTFSE